MTAGELAQATWRGRAAGERKAAARFAQLAASLDAHGFPSLGALAAKGVTDELAHVELCLELAGAVGPTCPLEPVVAWSRQRLVVEAVAFCCVTETLNTALVAEGLRRAADTKGASALRKILKDEVSHSKLGWAVLSSFPRSEVVSAGLQLAEFLRGAASADLFEPDGPMAPGEPTRAERRAIVSQTVSEVIIPGLEHFGVEVSGARAWLSDFEAKRPTAVHGHR